MPRAVLSREQVQRPRQVAVPGETLEFRAKVVRRARAGDLREFLSGRQRAAQQQIAGRFHAAIQIHRREYGLECVYEKALLGTTAGGFLTAAQLQIAAEFELVGDGEQVRGADQVILQEGKLALGETLKAMEKRFAYQQAEDGVSQELEALVIRLSFLGLNAHGLCLVGAGTVRNSTGQQRTVREAIAEGALEFVQTGLQLLRGRRAFCLNGAHSVRLRDALDLGGGVV